MVAHLAFLLAQRSPVMHLGDRFRPGQAGGDGPTILLVLLLGGGLALAWLVTSWLLRRRQRYRHSPRKLFHDLCTAHRLTRRQRRMLWRLAQLRRMAHPAILFLDPQTWEVSPPTLMGPQTLNELATLKQRLFDSR